MQSLLLRWFWLLGLGAILTGCGGPDLPWTFSGCDELDPSMCALPFPSTFHLRADDTAETGWRVALKSEHLPVDRELQKLDPTLWNERDGFSVASPLLAGFGDLDLSGVPGHASIARYADEDVQSVLIDLETGERVPHWVEVDAHAEDPDKRLTILWPAQRLAFGRRYVVAYRNLVRADGTAIEASPAFAILRDGERTDDGDLLARKDRYEDVIFPALEAAGFPREELVLAWEVQTASEASTRGRLVAMRDDALERVGDTGPTYRWKKVETFDCAQPGQRIWKTLLGEFDAPLYTDDPGVDTLLNRDEQGMPYADGTREATMYAVVPCSVYADPGPTHVIQYGHGILGDEKEAGSGWLERFLDEHRMILVMARQTGMSSEDYAAIGVMLARNLSRFPTMPERMHQGIVENLLLTRIILGALPADPELAVGDVALLDGDADKVAWYGISQGGIVGGAIVGASTDLDRAVFGVGGGPYAMLLPRSVDFETFFSILASRYEDDRDQMFLIHGMLTHLWDVGESAAWTDRLADKQILSQVAVGDAQVHLEGSRWQARSAGLPLLEDPTAPVFGLQTRAAPFTGSAYVEVDYTDVPDAPTVNLPPDKATDTHECPRRAPELQAQVVHFVRTGEITQTCPGGTCAYTFGEGCR